MGQTSYWGHLLLSNYSMSPDGYLRPTPNICRTVKVFELCANPHLTQIQPLKSPQLSQRFLSVLGVRWHIAATSARFFLHILRFLDGCWRLALEGWRIPPSSSLHFWSLSYVVQSTSQSRLVLISKNCWPDPLSEDPFLWRWQEGNFIQQPWWGFSGWLMAPFTQQGQEANKSRWETTSTQSVCNRNVILE